MEKRILFPADDGSLSILIPAPFEFSGMTVEQVAAKDVPAGKPYRIVNVSELPADREFRNAWEHDFTGAPVNTGV